MNQSGIQLLDLPDELILIILKKLDNIDVLYSLVDNDNDRLDILAQDKIFTSTLNLVLSNKIIFDRFCIDILPRIDHNIQRLILESESLKRVLSTGNYLNLTNLKLLKFDQDIIFQYFKDESIFSQIFKQQLTDLTLIYNDNQEIITSSKDYTMNIYAHILAFCRNLQNLIIHGSSITGYPGLSLCDLPSTTFSSSILTKLSINVCTFDDCLYLLDDRLKQLNTFIVRIYDIDAPSAIVHDNRNLFNLKHFSLTCHSHISTYDTRVLPLLHRMLNLHELTLCLTVRNRTSLIDGTHIQNEILLHMLCLEKFIFDIRTWNTINDSNQISTNEDIQRTFTDIGYRNVKCSIQYFITNGVLCHVFSIPFTFDYIQCINNNFPNVIFNYVLYLSVCDSSPFEHEFFLRIAQAFPLLKHFTVTNLIPQQKQTIDNELYTIAKYPSLTFLSVSYSDISYAEQFLLETKTFVPCLTGLRINYEQLKIVTENFTRNTTRNNCSQIKQLITEMIQTTYSDDLSLYFPSL